MLVRPRPAGNVDRRRSASMIMQVCLSQSGIHQHCRKTTSKWRKVEASGISPQVRHQPRCWVDDGKSRMFDGPHLGTPTFVWSSSQHCWPRTLKASLTSMTSPASSQDRYHAHSQLDRAGGESIPSHRNQHTTNERLPRQPSTPRSPFPHRGAGIPT